MKSPNRALQRTAPGVTACTPSRRPAMRLPRREARSQSLGSLGDHRLFIEIGAHSLSLSFSENLLSVIEFKSRPVIRFH